MKKLNKKNIKKILSIILFISTLIIIYFVSEKLGKMISELSEITLSRVISILLVAIIVVTRKEK